ncbi:MAG: DNA repair protein RadA [Christensenellales bacterium]
MAKKAKTVFICQECGTEHLQWMGKCTACGTWGSLVEEVVVPEKSDDVRSRSSSAKQGSKGPRPLRALGARQLARIDTEIGELNRVLGGGLVPGSLTLISGEPGIGKSTLIIQVAARLADRIGTVLYVSGEESEEQIKLRSDRVCGETGENLYVVSETNMENVLSMVEKLKPKFIIIDSIQTMYTDMLDSAPGSVSQVRACGNALMKLAKTEDIPIFIVAHVTKSGDLAGPKIVEHLVDTVLQFNGERDHEIRILRALKNRFGTTSEIGAFVMQENGMIEIKDLSATFIESRDITLAGSVISAIYEGSRPVFFEVQALTSNANVGFARRTAIGIDNQRLNMIIAVMEKKLGIRLSDKDVYVNIVGGMKPDSTSTDLAVALAIYSALFDKTSKQPSVAIGEVGLTGELRSVGNVDKIISEAERLGYKKLVVPFGNYSRLEKSGSISELDKSMIAPAKSLAEAVQLMQQ